MPTTFNIFKKVLSQVWVEVQAINPSTQEADAGGCLGVLRSPGHTSTGEGAAASFDGVAALWRTVPQMPDPPGAVLSCNCHCEGLLLRPVQCKVVSSTFK